MTIIRYFIPEDGDKEEQPNVFQAPKGTGRSGAPTLGQIKAAFPLKNDTFYFRFKAPVTPGGDREKGNFGVWMDCMEDNQPVPIWQGTIVAKVTRVAASAAATNDAHAASAFADDKELGHHKTTAPPVQTPSQQAAAQKQPPPAPSATKLAPVPETAPDLFGSGLESSATTAASPTTTQPTPSPHHASAVPDLMSGGNSSGTSKNNNNGGDLLGDFSSANHHPHSSSSNHSNSHTGASDFFGMTAPVPTATPPNAHNNTASFQPQQPTRQAYPNLQQQQQQQQHNNHIHHNNNNQHQTQQTKPQQQQQLHQTANASSNTKSGGGSSRTQATTAGNSFEKFAQKNSDFGDLTNWEM